MVDVLKSTTTASGELCVMTVLTIETQTLPATCSDLGNFHLRFTQFNAIDIMSLTLKLVAKIFSSVYSGVVLQVRRLKTQEWKTQEH